jgi:phosphohistidine swiveling domain-containing protein
MKKIIIGLVLIMVMGGGAFVFTRLSDKNSKVSIPLTSGVSLTRPSRTPELRGYITSVEGNEITIANEIGRKEITDEEKASRQKMSQAERQALLTQETANLTTENVIVLIPVGVPIVKGAGNAGNSVKAEMSELTKGAYVTLWQTEDIVEFVSLRGIAQ